MDRQVLSHELHTQHRQLARYLFIFEKNKAGEFVPSKQAKFSDDEMLRPGAVGDWSVKEMLAHLLDCELRFLDWYHSTEGQQLVEAPWLFEPPSSMADIPLVILSQPLEILLERLRLAPLRWIAFLEGIPETSIKTPVSLPGGAQELLANLVALASYRRYAWAKAHLRTWRKRHAGTYLNKTELLRRIRTERRRLDNNLAKLQPEQMEMAGVAGEWTIKDLLAHLVAWERLFCGWYAAGLSGEMVAVPAAGYSWGEINRLNQQIYNQHKDQPVLDVLVDYRLSYTETLALVETISEVDLFDPGRYAWTGEGSLVGYVLANTANHYRWANSQLRRWWAKLGESGVGDGG